METAEIFSIALTGDVMLGRGVNESLGRFGTERVWGNTAPALRSADLAVINLECVISDKGKPWTRWEKAFHFRADPMAIDALKSAGIDAVVISNNHVFDYEEEAFTQMLDLLEAAEIPYAGAGRNLSDARRPVMLKAGGLTVGLVGFTDNERGWAAGADRPGTNWVTAAATDARSLDAVRGCIDDARSKGAELVIFSIHWGPNMRERPTDAFREFARAVIDAGADVFHGHSAHVVQGVEIYRGKPIIYDAGDFVDDYAVDRRLRNDLGLLFLLHVRGNKPFALELLPVVIKDRQVNFGDGAEKEFIAARFKALCAEMGTEVSDDDGDLRIEFQDLSGRSSNGQFEVRK